MVVDRVEFSVCFRGRMVTCLCVSHRVFMAKSWGGCRRKLVKGWSWFSLKRSHNHCSLVSGIVARWSLVW